MYTYMRTPPQTEKVIAVNVAKTIETIEFKLTAIYEPNMNVMRTCA